MGVAEVENGRALMESGGLRQEATPETGGATIWVAEGARVTLTATPEGGYFVSEWTGACAGAEVGSADVRGPPGALKCEVTATTHLEAGVVFKEGVRVVWQESPSFGMLTASVVNGGALTAGDGATVGATVVFTATPGAGFYVGGWETGLFGSCEVGFAADFDAGKRECSGVLQTEIVSGVNAPIPIMTRLPQSTIYFSAGAGGTVLARVGGAEATVGGTVLHGVSVVFEARAFGGWTVGVWTGDCAGVAGGRCTVAASGGGEISVGVGFGDVDECEVNPNRCGDNSECTNTEGSFSCACTGSFVSPTGDGFNCSDCASTEVYDTTTNQCETPSAEVCGRLLQFFDGSACQQLVSCTAPAVRNENNQCACVAPNVGTAENCRAPSVDVCNDVARFYDGSGCVDFAECEGRRGWFRKRMFVFVKRRMLGRGIIVRRPASMFAEVSRNSMTGMAALILFRARLQQNEMTRKMSVDAIRQMSARQ